MADAGVLGEDDRVELLEGEIVEMAPIGSRHNACVDRLVALPQPQVAGRAILRVQGSIGLSPRSEPQPDVAVLRWRDDFYAEELPGPADVLLVVEVAESSSDTDRDKPRLLREGRHRSGLGRRPPSRPADGQPQPDSGGIRGHPDVLVLGRG
jgi:Uma2 family endonuclease